MSDEPDDKGFIRPRARGDSTDRSEHREIDGRCIKIDTPHYKVEVWGDVGDSFDDVMDKTAEAADKAKADIRDMADDTEKGGFQ